MANVGDTLVNCTGTGTSTDPYIFKNWKGFRECIAVSSAYCEYDSTVPENERIINLNDESPNGVAALVFNCTSVNGNGCSIINANITSYATNNSGLYAETNCSIKNLNFLNVIFPYNCFISSNKSQARFTFTNCQFSVLFLSSSGANFVSARSASALFSRCSITVKVYDYDRTSSDYCNHIFQGSDWSDPPGITADKCIIDIRCNTLDSSTHRYFVLNDSNYRLFLSNIKVIGRLPNNVELIVGYANSSHSKTSNIVVDCEAGYASPWGGDTCGLINTSKIANPSADSDYTAKNIHPVTSEELINVDFLDSLGFPILKADE